MRQFGESSLQKVKQYTEAYSNIKEGDLALRKQGGTCLLNHSIVLLVKHSKFRLEEELSAFWSRINDYGTLDR